MVIVKNSDKKRILSLIGKVKKLSEQGIKGEKVNAQEMLVKLLKKYNLSKFDLVNKPKKRTFKLVNYNDCQVIMTHCILDTIEEAKINGIKQKKELYCNLTDEQYVDVCEKFNHYYPLYYEQIQNHEKKKETLLKAFLIKNNLGISNEGGFEEQSDVLEIASVMGEVKENRYGRKNLKAIN